MNYYLFRLPLWVLVALWWLHRRAPRPAVAKAPNWLAVTMALDGLIVNMPRMEGRLDGLLAAKVLEYLAQSAEDASLASRLRIVMTGALPGKIRLPVEE